MSTTIVQHDTFADTPLESARRRLRRLLARVRVEQAAAVALRGLLIGLAAALTVVATLLLVDMLAVLGPDVRRWLRWVPALALVGGMAGTFARARPMLDPLRLALLLERRHPQLQHVLPTAAVPWPRCWAGAPTHSSRHCRRAAQCGGGSADPWCPQPSQQQRHCCS